MGISAMTTGRTGLVFCLLAFSLLASVQESGANNRMFIMRNENTGWGKFRPQLLPKFQLVPTIPFTKSSVPSRPEIPVNNLLKVLMDQNHLENMNNFSFNI